MAGFPESRLRRLRRTAGLRTLVRETRVSSQELVLPLFVLEGQGRREPIEGLPGIERTSLDELARDLSGIGEAGLGGVPRVRRARPQGRGRLCGLRARRHRPQGRPPAQGRAARASGHHRRMPVQLHKPRALRPDPERRDRQRPLDRADREGCADARRGRRRARGAERHDGWTRGRDPGGARPGGSRERWHPLLRGQVRVGLLRAVSSRGRLLAGFRRQARLPDGSRQQARRRSGRSPTTSKRPPTRPSSSPRSPTST